MIYLAQRTSLSLCSYPYSWFSINRSFASSGHLLAQSFTADGKAFPAILDAQGKGIDVTDPKHPRHEEYVKALQDEKAKASASNVSPAQTPSVQSSTPSASAQGPKLSQSAMTPEQYDLLSDSTQRLLVVLYGSPSSVPDDALTHPVRLADYRRTAALYQAAEDSVKAQVQAPGSTPSVITVGGVKVDYAKATASDYVILDPNKPTVVLYMTTREYLTFLAQMASAGLQVKVLLGPGEIRQSQPTPRGAPHVSGSLGKFILSGLVPFGYLNFLPDWVRKSTLNRLVAVSQATIPTFTCTRSLLTTHRGVRVVVRSYAILFTVLILTRPNKALRQGCLQVLYQFYDGIRNNGLSTTCLYYKEAQRILMQYLNGTPVKASELKVRITSDGLPGILPGALRQRIRNNDLNAIRLSLFVLQCPKLIVYTAKPKLHTITTPAAPIDKALLHRIEAFVPVFRQLLANTGFTPAMPEDLKVKKYHFTTKAGPNGPALLTSLADAVALASHKSFNDVTRYLLHTHQEPLLNRIKSIAEHIAMVLAYLPMRPIGTWRVGRICEAPLPYGKVRIFAIPTYWVQVLMFPVHQVLFRCLKSIQTDYTYDQLKAIKTVIDSGAVKIWSYDLSAATDRFPLSVQELVLPALFGEPSSAFAEEWARLWGGILRNTTFEYTPSLDTLPPRVLKHVKSVCKPLLKEALDVLKKYSVAGPLTKFENWIPSGVSVSLRTIMTSHYCKPVNLTYNAGQPMGTYSSWAAFALSHHFVVQMAAYEITGQALWYDKYCLLGDDIVLWSLDPTHDLISARYTELMGGLGVEVNPSKGFISTTGTFEFAKRFIRQGVDLSVFHWKELFPVCNAAKYHQYLKYHLLPLAATLPLERVCRAFTALLPTMSIPDRARINTAIERNSWFDACQFQPIKQLMVLILSPFGVSPTSYGEWLQFVKDGAIPSSVSRSMDLTHREARPSLVSTWRDNPPYRSSVGVLVALIYESILKQLKAGLSKTFSPLELMGSFFSRGSWSQLLESADQRATKGQKWLKVLSPWSAWLRNPTVYTKLWLAVAAYHPFQGINLRSSLVSWTTLQHSPNRSWQDPVSKALAFMADASSASLMLRQLYTACYNKHGKTNVAAAVALAKSAKITSESSASDREALRFPSGSPAQADSSAQASVGKGALRLLEGLSPDSDLDEIDTVTKAGSRAFLPKQVEKLQDPLESVRILEWASLLAAPESTVIGRFLEIEEIYRSLPSMTDFGRRAVSGGHTVYLRIRSTTPPEYRNGKKVPETEQPTLIIDQMLPCLEYVRNHPDITSLCRDRAEVTERDVSTARTAREAVCKPIKLQTMFNPSSKFPIWANSGDYTFYSNPYRNAGCVSGVVSFGPESREIYRNLKHSGLYEGVWKSVVDNQSIRVSKRRRVPKSRQLSYRQAFADRALGLSDSRCP